MIDIQKQIDYWRKGAVEDFPVGIQLAREGNVRHGLFFIHLALEKIIKALVCRFTGDLAPRTHNLVRLLETSGIAYTKDDILFIANMNKHNIEGRYPDSYEEPPAGDELGIILSESERVFTWLRNQL